MKLQKQGKLYTSEEQLGYDMEKLIEKFSGHALISNMTSYKNLVRVFQEQFVNGDGKAELNPHPGGKVLLNPSDPDAEIGHKGPGYQVQIAETCSDKNDVQLITAAIPQGGSESDMDSPDHSFICYFFPPVLKKILTDLNKKDFQRKFQIQNRQSDLISATDLADFC